jgi:hypothetical protein
MFGEEFLDVPIVQASIDGTLNPLDNWNVGKAVAQLRFVNIGPRLLDLLSLLLELFPEMRAS